MNRSQNSEYCTHEILLEIFKYSWNACRQVFTWNESFKNSDCCHLVWVRPTAPKFYDRRWSKSYAKNSLTCGTEVQCLANAVNACCRPWGLGACHRRILLSSPTCNRQESDGKKVGRGGGTRIVRKAIFEAFCRNNRVTDWSFRCRFEWQNSNKSIEAQR